MRHPGSRATKERDARVVEVGSHADVRVTRTDKLSIGVDEVRELVRTLKAAAASDGTDIEYGKTQEPWQKGLFPLPVMEKRHDGVTTRK